jgi:nitrogen fixation NifU-like protein
MNESYTLYNETVIKTDDITGTIMDAKFKTFGCGSAIAASSMATELIKGKSIDELEKYFSNDDIVNALGGLPPVKIHCSVLAEAALKAALDDYKKKHNIQ